MLFLLGLFQVQLAFAAPVGATVEFSPTSDSIYVAADAEGKVGCTLTLAQGSRGKILSETDSQLEIQWEKKAAGCYYATWIKGMNLQHTFVRKNDLVWKDPAEPKGELEPKPAPIEDSSATYEMPPRCANQPLSEEPLSAEPVSDNRRAYAADEKNSFASAPALGALIQVLHNQAAGMKNGHDVDKYMDCYPLGDAGKENYQRYKKFIGLAADHFRLENDKHFFEVNPTLMACLLRRESGYDPSSKSFTNAVGLGQHTTINIKDLSERLHKEGSWEASLWHSFFQRVKKDPEGRRLLRGCMGGSRTDEPTFNSKNDAACPLQSIAASAIYNLQIQRALTNSANVNAIRWEDDLQYQLAVAASYNLGGGAASKAVHDLFLGGWVNSILRKSGSGDKHDEVMAHISAIRNCMQSGNWKPMNAGDHAQCEDAGVVKAASQAALRRMKNN